MKKVGLYIHVPFCVKKCGYCDFYSVAGNEQLMDEYTAAVTDALGAYRGKISADTVYFGGGTPSVLGGKRISAVLNAAREMISDGAEITVELNPGDSLNDFYEQCSAAGVNRVSIGLQSADDNELRLLTRRHTASDVKDAVRLARLNGISNISLDLMLGIEGQTKKSIANSVDFCADLGVNHISAYMLKIEEGTPFARAKGGSRFPDEDAVADMYLFAVGRLADRGYEQYEISNFAANGAKSRHNLKYWNCEEYVGIGPSAHSFYGGKRFFYPRSITDFISGKKPVSDGSGGDFDEYAMLRLRLSDGLIFTEAKKRFSDAERRYEKLLEKAQRYEQAGLCAADGDKIALNSRGFLVSNMIIGDLLG